MADIYSILKSLSIEYKKHEHPPVYTVTEAQEHYTDIEGGDSKSLFLRNKKGDTYYLALVESHKNTDLRDLAKQVGEAKLSFASPEKLKEYLDLTPGAVSPFGLINNKEKDVVVIVDTDLLRHEKLHYHPNVNTATLVLSKKDLETFLESTGNQFLYIEIQSR